MAKQTGLGDRILVSGRDLSGDIGSIQSIRGGNSPLVYTDITQDAFDRAGGRRDGGLDFTAWFNDALTRAHPILSTLPRNDVAITYCRGYGIGRPCASMLAKQIGYDGTRGADGQFTLVVNAVSNAYGMDWGIQLTDGLRTDSAATNGASVDGAASSSFGAQFFLHATAFTGTSVTVKIQDSADNSAWADLSGATFTAVTTAGSSQRIAVTGTVRRYLRVATTGTFTNAVFLVHGTRNETAVVF